MIYPLPSLKFRANAFERNRSFGDISNTRIIVLRCRHQTRLWQSTFTLKTAGRALATKPRIEGALVRVRQLRNDIVDRVQALHDDTSCFDAHELVREATLSALIDAALQSSAIEGEQLKASHVRSATARRLGIPGGATTNSSASDRRVEGVVEMLVDAWINRDEPVTRERLWHWHAALLSTGHRGFDKITVGGWRTGPIQVASGRADKTNVHFTGPDAQRVPGEMQSFLDWFNTATEQDDLYTKSALAHLYFVTVHPLDDGNGRIARALGDILLARADAMPGRFYSLASQILLERGDYYAALEAVQKGTLDVTAWVVWYLGCLGRAMEKAALRIDDAKRKAALLKAWSAADLNERQSKMLHRLLDAPMQGHLTVARWSRATHVSQETALRDIDELVTNGMLVEVDGELNLRHRYYQIANSQI